MAVLGVGGRLELKRCAPEPCILSPDSLDSLNNEYESICDGYWSGDHIAANCLPVTEGEYPANPSGYATYFGGKWFLGPNRDHITSFNDLFYKTDTESYPDGQFGDDAQFYAREGDEVDGEIIPGCDDEGGYWIHIDDLGRVSFYSNRCDALAGCPDTRLDLDAVGGNITIAPWGSLEYINAIWACIEAIGEYRFSDGQDTVTLISICKDPPLYQKPEANPNTETFSYDNADLLPRGQQGNGAAPYWTCMMDIREWTLQLDAPSVDTTSVSEKFGEAVKSLVNGGGSTEFFVERQCMTDLQADSNTLMKLLFMTENGCNADARFYLIDREGCGYDCDSGLLKGELYYEASILITATAINVRPTEMIAGTAQFVTTGPIRLKEAS